MNNILDECEIKGFQYHPIFQNQYDFDLDVDTDGDAYSYKGPCGASSTCINHEFGWTCECLISQPIPPASVPPYNQRFRRPEYDLGQSSSDCIFLSILVTGVGDEICR